LSTDYAVPVAKSKEMLAIYRRELDPEFRDAYVVFGHIGDAHLHINTFCESEAQFAKAKQILNRLARIAVEFGGTVGAEHGLGKRKAHLLSIQYSTDEIEVMRRVKRRFDPEWLLGRGTLFPAAN
jgi:FAD/FMN-containing dehydrogenase